jgi:ligand-binding sensor domain-containing protein
MHDQVNANSLAYNWAECMVIDSSGMIWIGTYGGGLNSYDPSANSFKHFKHDPKNSYSLANDTVTALLEDSKGNLWVGTYGGLDLMDRKSGRFRHYANKPGDATSLSHNHVRILYEDRKGILWIGSGSPFFDVEETPEAGGLNRYNNSDGTFTRYLHDPSNPNSIATNKVSALLEDSRGNFWVGTSGYSLHIMDRSKGIFAHIILILTIPKS